MKGTMHSTEIAAVRFSTTKWREGYAMEDVDGMREKIRASLLDWEAGRPGELKADSLAQLEFQPTKFRAGYDQDQVDKFLAGVAATLKKYESGEHP